MADAIRVDPFAGGALAELHGIVEAAAAPPAAYAGAWNLSQSMRDRLRF
jgi:hypothetical protein